MQVPPLLLHFCLIIFPLFTIFFVINKWEVHHCTSIIKQIQFRTPHWSEHVLNSSQILPLHRFTFFSRYTCTRASAVCGQLLLCSSQWTFRFPNALCTVSNVFQHFRPWGVYSTESSPLSKAAIQKNSNGPYLLHCTLAKFYLSYNFYCILP